MSICQHLRQTVCAVTLASVAALPPAHAQVGPAGPPPPAASATAAMRPGWIATAVALRNGKEGEVPLASAIVPANTDEAWAVLGAKEALGSTGVLVLRGMVNPPEEGRYGFVLQIPLKPIASCTYALNVDGKEVMTGTMQYNTAQSADGAITLPADFKPIELHVGCSGVPVSQVRVTLKVKAPSDNEPAVPSASFIVHKLRASGD